MSRISSQSRMHTWKRDQYVISTDSSLVPIKKIGAVFASPIFYWAKALPDAVLKETLENSLCFGLYQSSVSQSGTNPADLSSAESRTNAAEVAPTDATTDAGHVASEKTKPDLNLIGFARCITDYTTFLYLTDVWVDELYQGKGLGKWLITCVQEVIEKMPYLRRSMLFTADWERSVPFYEKLMDMTLLETQRNAGLAIMERKGLGHPSYGSNSSSYN
ncbi:hypothetical protein PFICI_00465 [Pestalotiopsis fici W106-1]|uniref:N-acetyltransferase domain-containing protein n=1 Tax=Pestalotiopsis fici (strain W106-1 / CGMCC3.15140) TaxID=1229662 RepID=W3XMC1_PESFW|nr:uncharacterized protein PFICI_00465 [Pestalotiopsis fici W106-1]ETS86637.1 hypothetical protein PFICI_00465 [Pestalotiopsis fici W106-1]